MRTGEPSMVKGRADIFLSLCFSIISQVLLMYKTNKSEYIYHCLFYNCQQINDHNKEEVIDESIKKAGMIARLSGIL